jgi:hypothetical protein
MPKYVQYYNQMIEQNQAQFDQFRRIHDLYVMHPDQYQLQYNQLGAPIQAIIQDWENRLCKQTEKGLYSKYSEQLAEKFRQHVQKHFPKINAIGLTRGPKAPLTKGLETDDDQPDIPNLLA